MATKEEYALLTAASYPADPSVLAPLPTGWRELLDPVVDEGGFAASVYINDGTGEIVIAYRGTNAPVAVDWIARNIPSGAAVTAPQVHSAIELYSLVQSLNPSSTITFTGHSLAAHVEHVARRRAARRESVCRSP